MRLLLVVHQYFPECRSGTEQYTRAIAREATRRGDEVVVLSLDPWVGRDDPPLRLRDEPYEGLPALRLRHWWGLSPHDVLLDYDVPIVARRFRALLDDVRPDAVHFLHLRRLGAGLIAAARDFGARVVVNLMDFWFLCPRFTLLRSDGALCEGPPEGGLGCLSCEFEKLTPLVDATDTAALARAAARGLRSSWFRTGAAGRLAGVLRRKEHLLARLALADAIVAPSRFLAGMFARNGFPAERLTVVPYGLEPGRVARTAVARPRDPLRVAFAGVLSPWKGPQVLIRAVRSIPDVPLLVTLYGNLEEQMFAEHVATLRALAGDDERIRFAGAFGHGELDAVMADTDLLVVPSTWYENTPFVVLEAFEAGVPVAVSDLGGMTEVLDERVNGFRFPAGDSAALAELLRSLVDDPQRIARLDPRPVAGIADNYEVFRALYAPTAPDSARAR
ncbi:MAG: glycosyltransferase family 4 protein [Planctomycetes bacterium]|nr:glycosyltransferase family 4 protein [Planctomycetota bacterium]